MLSEKQQSNYKFFESHLSEYQTNPLLRGRYCVFSGEELQGAFDSFESAYSEACARFPADEFIIQQILDASSTVEFLFTAEV